MQCLLDYIYATTNMCHTNSKPTQQIIIWLKLGHIKNKVNFVLSKKDWLFFDENAHVKFCKWEIREWRTMHLAVWSFLPISPNVCLKVLDVRVYCHSALCRQFSGELVCSGPLEAGGRGPGDWTVEAAGTASHPTPANHSTASRAMPQHCLQQPSIPCCLH